MLEVTGLTKKYKDKYAVKDLTISVPSGEIAVLVGPNGAGKTTAINGIVGFIDCTGDVKIDGFENKSIEAKKLIGLIPEMATPYDYLTVDEHMEYIAKVYGVENWEEKAKKLMDTFEITKQGGKLGKELSKGMKQKLNICTTLLHEPKLVIFDEPFIGLDPYAIKNLKEIMEELRDKGCTVLIITHILDTISTIWDRAYILVGGEFRITLTKQELEACGEDLETLFFEHTKER